MKKQFKYNLNEKYKLTTFSKIIMETKILTNDVTDFLNSVIYDSILSLNDNGEETFTTMKDLYIHLYDIISELYKQVFNKPIGKYHKDYLQMLIHKVIYDYETFMNFNWQEDYRDHYYFMFEPQDEDYKKKRVEILNNKPKQVQGTQEWLRKRQTCLTASNITNIINNRNLDYILLDKCGYDKLTFASGPAIRHGKKFEDVAVLIYENRTGLKLYSDYGCIPHEDFSFIAASPDGIDELGNVVEIKCVYSRQLTGLPKEDYYDQMQLQMEVFGLNKCFFLECELREYLTYKDYKKDVYTDANGNVNETKTSQNMEKGVIVMISSNNEKNPLRYIYPPHLKMNHKEAKQWGKDQKALLKKTDPDKKTWTSCETIYWKLTDISCIAVYKDQNWIYRNLTNFHQFWKKVTKYKENKQLYNQFVEEYERKKQQKITKQQKIDKELKTTCLLDDSDED